MRTPDDRQVQLQLQEVESSAPTRREQPLENRRAQRHRSRTGSTWAAFMRDVRGATRLEGEAAELAAVSVVGALTRRIQAGERRKLLSQLPQRLEELLPRQGSERPQRFSLEELVDSVASDLRLTHAQAEPIVRAVFQAVRAHVSDGEAEGVAANLPGDIRSIWALSH